MTEAAHRGLGHRGPASRRHARRAARRAGCVALAACLLCAAPALAQTPPSQIDPSVPTTIPQEDLNDFKGYLDQVMDDIMAANGPTILNAGNTLWRGLAAIVVVWTGIKIAMSGTFSMWALIELVIGLWIPWVMLLFYATPIPGVGFTFPGMIAGGGNWMHSLFPVRHCARRADRALESRHHADHRPLRCVGRHLLAGAVQRPRGRDQQPRHRHGDDAVHCSLSGRHLRRDVRPGHLGANGDPDSDLRRADADPLARL